MHQQECVLVINVCLHLLNVYMHFVEYTFALSKEHTVLSYNFTGISDINIWKQKASVCVAKIPNRLAVNFKTVLLLKYFNSGYHDWLDALYLLELPCGSVSCDNCLFGRFVFERAFVVLHWSVCVLIVFILTLCYIELNTKDSPRLWFCSMSFVFYLLV